jgi:hypothetical protein
MPVSGGALVVVVIVAMGLWAGPKIGHGVKKVAQKGGHAIVHVVTLGKR